MLNAVIDRALWNNAISQIARRTNDRQSAEDMLHSAYLRLEKYCQDHQVEHTYRFLTRTAINLWIDTKRRDGFLRDHMLEISLTMNYPAPLQEKMLEDRERLKRLEDGLDELSPRTCEVFLLAKIDGLRYRQIASRLNMSESAVEKHIAKASAFLSDWMEDWD